MKWQNTFTAVGLIFRNIIILYIISNSLDVITDLRVQTLKSLCSALHHLMEAAGTSPSSVTCRLLPAGQRGSVHVPQGGSDPVSSCWQWLTWWTNLLQAACGILNELYFLLHRRKVHPKKHSINAYVVFKDEEGVQKALERSDARSLIYTNTQKLLSFNFITQRSSVHLCSQERHRDREGLSHPSGPSERQLSGELKEHYVVYRRRFHLR